MLAISESAPARVEEGAWRPAAWQIWLASAALLFLIALPRILVFAPDDPDDFMRLAQVRDLLAGQSWFDVRQYRMDPPSGADVHWSRLADLPLAAFLLLFRVFLAEPWASVAAMTAVPLLQLALAIVLLRGLMRTLGASEAAALAASTLALFFPLLLDAFLPLRVDHHGWQALGALGTALLVVRGGWRNAFAGGALAAATLTVSLEFLPLAALAGGICALRYVRFARREYEGYLVGLAITGALLFVTTRPLAQFSVPHCDQLSWPHFAAFAGAGLIAVFSRLLPGQETFVGRLIALSGAGAVAALSLSLPLGTCAIDPFAGMDPLLREQWIDRVPEGLPLWMQKPSVVAMLLWTVAIVAAGAWIAVRSAADPVIREHWSMLALLALGTGALSLVAMRAGLAAQMLAVPFAAILAVKTLPQARALGRVVPRVLATALCLVLVTPTLASASFKPLDALGSKSEPTLPSVAGTCEIARLSALPRAHLFAPFDLGPEILVRTGHTVVAGPYHRNQRAMRAVWDAYSATPTAAREVVTLEQAEYLVACLSGGRLEAFAEKGDNTLAGALLADRVPPWLSPVPGFESGALKVWKVR